MEAHRDCNNQHLALGSTHMIGMLHNKPYHLSDRLQMPRHTKWLVWGAFWTQRLADACSDPEVPPAASEDEAAPFLSPNKRTAAGNPVLPPPPLRNAHTAARRERDPAHRESDEELQVRFTSKTRLYNSALKAMVQLLRLASLLFVRNPTASCAEEFRLVVQQLELRTSEGLEALLGQVGASMAPGRQQALQVGRQHGKHALQPDIYASSSSKVRSFGKECSVHAFALLADAI